MQDPFGEPTRVGGASGGNAGEEELNRQMQRFGESFNHNVHALRVVDSFEQRYARFPGLNLTFEVREGIVKHSRDLLPGADPELDEYLPVLVSGLVSGTVNAAESAGVDDHEAVRRVGHRLAAFTPAAQQTAQGLRNFLRDQVYFAEPLVSDRQRSAAMIAELFEYFLEEPDKLPENYVEEMHNQPLHRIVCDYIAGMTDGFFLRCYQQAYLQGAEPRP